MKIRPLVIATHRARGLVAGLFVVLLAACASESSLRSYVPHIVTPYRIDIQQGNFITPDMLQKLAVGQTREQVRFILGTPLLVDIFRTNRWDYVFRSAKGWNEPEKRKLIVFFDASGRVERWEADLPEPAPAAPDKPTADPQPKAQAPTPPAVPAPAQAVSQASNLTIDAAAPAATVAQASETTSAAASVPPSLPGPASAAAPAPAAAAPSKATASAASVAISIPLSPPAAPIALASAGPQVAALAAPALAVPQVSAATPAPPAAATPAPAATASAAPAAAATPTAILSALEQWRAAWARRDADRYLSMYAADFTPPPGLTRAQWEAQRRLRLQRASFIVVKLLDPQISLAGDNAATAVFTQVYESDAQKESGRKTLALVQAGGQWRIRDESFRK